MICEPFVIKMTMRQWIAVRDNVKQRHTPQRAERAKHLHKADQTHKSVCAGLYRSRCCGNPETMDVRQLIPFLVKADAHTRAYISSTGRGLSLDDILIVTVHPIDTVEDEKALYDRFDSKEAVQTAQDILIGAYRETGMPIESPLCTGGWGLTQALNIIYGTNGRRNVVSMAARVREWRTEIEIFESLGLRRSHFTSEFLGAALVTIRAFPAEASEFWRVYSAEAGLKDIDGADGAHELNNVRLSNVGRRRGKGATRYDLAGRVLSCFDHWRNNEKFTGGCKVTSWGSWLEKYDAGPSKQSVAKGSPQP